MHFFDLPREDVLEQRLLPYLNINDILRLRRVSKLAKLLADDYLRLQGHKRLGKIEINSREGDEKSFGNFLELGFSVSKVVLKTYGPESLGSAEKTLEFLEKHGGKVKEVEVDNFYCCRRDEPTQAEFGFFLGLDNLESLQIGTVHMPKCWTEGNFPLNFTRLKAVKINKVIAPVEDMQPIDDYVNILFIFCYKAEYLKVPAYRHAVSEEQLSTLHLLNTIGQVIAGKYIGNPALKAVDLEYFSFVEEPFCQCVSFYRLAAEKRLKLIGMDAGYVEIVKMIPLGDGYEPERGELEHPPITSVINLCPTILDDVISKEIEEINIVSTRQCLIPAVEGMDAQQWPNLKRLSVCVDSRSSIGDLYTVLFGGGAVHFNLTQLALLFEGGNGEDGYIFPSAEAIVQCCPNLTRLQIRNWPGNDQNLQQFWVLENLEEVCLDDCKTVGDEAFVGEDKENPVFLQLKKLKKLELRNVNAMPGITDALFSRVLSRMNLTHLILHSSSPIQNVTENGIRELLAGQFATSIEKFPFKEWRIVDAAEETMENLAKEFRSSRMM